jgi:capping protein alpha
MAEVTDAEIIQIANSFLLASPPGEFMEVVTDVRGLLPDDSLINDSAPATFREWNTDQMLQVKSPKGDHEVLISKYGEVNEAEYLDPRGNCVIQFDHIRQEVVGSRPISGELDKSVEDYRGAFDAAAFEYLQEHYINGGVTVYGGKQGGQTNITICISSSKFNPNNYWNGRWRSIWQCSVSGGKVSLTGNMKLQVHYFEDGNVQLVSDTKKTGNVNGSDPKSAAAAALKQIARIEAEFQEALNQSYALMGDTTFKALRRVLPITTKKIDWDIRRIQALRLGSAVGKS